ncbi:MAG: prolyl oligopeptidase family serine peptidase [Halobacteriaceae archaeon]
MAGDSAAAIDPAALHELSRVGGVAVSPDGDRVAFVATESNPDADERPTSVFVAPTDGSAPPHRLTRASGASGPTWSPDGSRLAVLATRETDVARRVGRDEDGDEGDEANGTDTADDDADDGDDDPETQVWAWDLDRGGDAAQVTDFEEGVREFDWSPDGDRLVVSVRDPTADEREELDRREEGGPIEIERLQHKRDGAGWLDEVTTYLFVVDADTGESRRLDDAYGAGSVEPLAGLQPAWGERGIAFLSNRTDRPDDSMVMDVFLVAPDGGEAERLTGGDVWARSPEWGPDGQRLAFVAGDPYNWYLPGSVSVAEPDGSVTELSGDVDRPPAGTPRWVDAETICCPFGDRGWTRLVALDADGGGTDRVFGEQGRDRELGAVDVAGGTAALTLSAPNETGDVYAADADAIAADAGPTLTQVSSLEDGFFADRPAPGFQRLTVENDAGDEIEALAFYPADFDPGDPEPHPTIAAIHGGPMAYDAPNFRFAHALWASRGYVVVRVNYRGSTSYGRAFAERLRGSRGPVETADVVAGVDALVDRGWADPDRLFVTGFSHGGTSTAHVVTRTDRFAAAAAEHGIYDFYSLFGTDDNHLWHEDEFGLPWEEPETYRDVSSITRVDQIETPLLVTAGENDWRCPPSQAEQLYVSVRKRDVDAKLVVYQDENHAISRPERAVHRLETLLDWFEAHDPAREETGDD